MSSNSGPERRGAVIPCNVNDVGFLPGVGLIKAFLVFFNDSFKQLADLSEHLKPGKNNEEHCTDDIRSTFF